ncbi:Na+/H+ antiporter NhaC family protein [uncultured Prevotella sp.]|uniref:Na+/H+ antiporter NhaC family protein n=1 Tax=uncultured Prevotella sp. TaxID=159272 RepID=UPI00262142DE|nr:Na+/H+ antiporter NhaC family protein [uncultured Prevotella sp.]
MNHKQGILAISPLIVFVILYFVSSIIAGDFYMMPITVAFMLSCIYAIMTFRGRSVKDRVETFCIGAGEKNIMMMLCIFVLAGAFANSAKDAGCIEATVNLTLSLMPDSMIMAGLFIAACFISLAIGTSVGTIVALTPIAAGLAHSTGSSVPMMTAVIVGGSFFGDNLSFISDTTIVATSTQGCKQSDKFLVNSYTTIPVAIAVMVMYFFIGTGTQAPAVIPDIDYVKILPYIIVIVCALCGMNVFVVLTFGIISTGLIGIGYGVYDLFGWCQSMGKGITGMGELVIVAVLAGGLLKVMTENGALEYLISIMTKKIRSKRSCELTIAMLVSLVNICTANNTVAILTVGSISKRIGDSYGVDNRKSASILDSFSCCIQSILPYGAQILMATGLAAVSPIEILKYLYYPFVLFCVSVIAILIRYPKKYS